jgi:hypothetical protein
MDSASRIMKGLAAAGQAVVDEAVKAAAPPSPSRTDSQVTPGSPSTPRKADG